MRKPVVWITRTSDGAKATADAVTAMGGEAILAPVLKAVPLKPIIDPHSFDAVILTSRNGLTAFRALVSRRSITAWCVGDATAQAAREAGYQTVLSAQGDAEALIRLIIDQADPHGRLLYAAPAEPSSDIAGQLRQAGFVVSEVAVYETRPVVPAISAGDMARLSHVLIHSAKAGRAVAAVLAAHPQRFSQGQLCFICMSQAAWHGLEQGLAGETLITPGLLNRRISPFPDEASMLRLID